MVWGKGEGRLVWEVLTSCTPAQCLGGHLDLKSWWLWQGSSFHFLEFSLFYFLTWAKKGQPVFRKGIQKQVRSQNISVPREFVMIQRVPGRNFRENSHGEMGISQYTECSIHRPFTWKFIVLHVLPPLERTLLTGWESGLMFGYAGFYGEKHTSIMSSHMTRK